MAWAEREAVKQRYLVDATRARLSRGRIIKALERVHPLSVRACEVGTFESGRNRRAAVAI